MPRNSHSGVRTVALPPALQLGIDPDARRPLRDEAYLTLRRAILAGDFRPGDRLVEREVAAKLHLSRSPVREAFRRLEQEGLVNVSRQGVFVQELDSREMADLYEVRQHLEILVARLAARRFRPGHLPRLQEVLQAMSRAAEFRDQEALSAEGSRFHAALGEIAGNRRLARMTASIAEEIDRYRHLNLAQAPRSATALDEHHSLMQAVVARDEAAAERLMAEHIAHSLQAAQELTRRTSSS